MFERFTDKSIKVIMLAQEEARRLGHNYVGTEQILLGLCGEGTGLAARALKQQGLNLKDLRVEVEAIIGRGSGNVSVEIPFTPRAKRLLELSWDEARTLDSAFIDTALLLLGLLRLRENSQGLTGESAVGVRVLQNMGVDLDALRRLTAELLSKEPPAKIAAPVESMTPLLKLDRRPELKQCPSCGELVQPAAIRCRYCYAGLSDEHFKNCSHCLESIKREAIKCRHCQSDLSP